MPRRLLALVLLLGLCLAVLLPGLGRLTMERQQELRVALVARNMAEGGSWLIPEFQNNPRLRKPPLMYWITAAAFKAAGDTGSALVARIPSATSGILLIFTLYGFGASLMGRRRALVGAAMAATSFLFIRHARLAETDTTLVLFTTLAVWSGYRARFASGAWTDWLGLGLFAGLGFLTKGPAALAVPVLTMLAGEAVNRERPKAPLKPARLAAAILLAAAVAAPWYIKMLALQHELPEVQHVLGNELSDTFIRTKHPGSLFYYVLLLPLLMLPWGVLLPCALWRFWKRGRHHAALRYAFSWWLVTFVLLSVVTSKQAHYTLLLLPSTALLLGWYLCLLPAGRTLTGVNRSSWPRRLVPWAGVGLILVAGYAYGIYPRMHAESRIPGFIGQETTRVANAPLIHVVGINSAIFDFYTRREVHNTESIRHAYNRAGAGDLIMVIAPEKDIRSDDLPGADPLRDERHRRLRYIMYLK